MDKITITQQKYRNRSDVEWNMSFEQWVKFKSLYNVGNTNELFHITKEKYLPNILLEGLRVNSGKIGFCKKEIHKEYKEKYGYQPIFLTNDINYISKTMLTNKWVNKNKAIVLKITDIHLNEKNSSCGWFVDTINGCLPKEFRYFSNIEPNHIEIIDMNLKKLV